MPGQGSAASTGCCVASSWACKVAHPVLSLFHNFPLSLQHHAGTELTVYLPETHSLSEQRKAKRAKENVLCSGADMNTE